jgi:hypothetical protein
MKKPGPLPEFGAKPDGSLPTRFEREKELREKASRLHERRRLAMEKYGLPAKVAYDMKTITLIHWILDKMIEYGEVSGEYMGVSSELGADDDKENFDRFTQLLALFIERGWAVTPNDGEGIDMNKINVPPVPAQIPGGAPGFPAPPMPPAPPAMPSMPGQPMAAPPPPPPGMPGMPPSMPMAQPPAPQGSPPAMPMPPIPHMPAAPTGQFGAAPAAPAPQMPQAPVGGAPVAQPAAAPQQGGDPGGPPDKADPRRAWGSPGFKPDGSQRSRRSREEVQEDEAYDYWIQACQKAGIDPNSRLQQQSAPTQQPAAQMPSAPAPTAPPPPTGYATAPMTPGGYSQTPQQQGFAAPMPAAGGFAAPVQPQGGAMPQQSPDALEKKIDQLSAQVAELTKKVSILTVLASQTLRGIYGRQGAPTPESILQELGFPPSFLQEIGVLPQ